MSVRWFGDITGKLLQQGVVGLIKAGHILLWGANDDCPFKTGYLRSTGKVTIGTDEVIVSYDTPYAIRLHEHPEFRFNNGKKGKWLEDRANLLSATGFVAEALKRIL
jgi:hypothetical protein